MCESTACNPFSTEKNICSEAGLAQGVGEWEKGREKPGNT